MVAYPQAIEKGTKVLFGGYSTGNLTGTSVFPTILRDIEKRRVSGMKNLYPGSRFQYCQF